MTGDGDGDRIDGVERVELGLVEADAVPILEREDDFHVLQRVPRIGACSRRLRARSREPEHVPQKRIDFIAKRFRIHAATRMPIAGESSDAAIRAKGTWTSVASSSTLRPA